MLTTQAERAVIYGLEEGEVGIVKPGGLVLPDQPFDPRIVAKCMNDIRAKDVVNRECPKGSGTPWRPGTFPEPRDGVRVEPAEQDMKGSMPDRDPTAAPCLADVVQQAGRDKLVRCTALFQRDGDRNGVRLIGRRKPPEHLDRSGAQSGRNSGRNVWIPGRADRRETRMKDDLPNSMVKTLHQEVNEPVTQIRPK